MPQWMTQNISIGIIRVTRVSEPARMYLLGWTDVYKVWFGHGR